MTSGTKLSMEGRSFNLLIGSRWRESVCAKLGSEHKWPFWLQTIQKENSDIMFNVTFRVKKKSVPSDHNKQSSHKRWVRHSRKVSLLLKIPERNSESWRQLGKTLLTSSEKYVLLCLLSDCISPEHSSEEGHHWELTCKQLPELECLQSSRGLLLDSTSPCAGSQVKSAIHTVS